MVLFIGHYLEVLEKLDDLLGVDYVIVENQQKKNKDVLKYCRSQNLNFITVKNSSDLDRFISDEDKEVDLVLVASFGIIFNENFIDQCEHIINIHPGNLQFSRGRHPLPYMISKGYEFMSLTAHRIDDRKIDAGNILIELNIPIDYKKDYNYNYKILRGNLKFLTEKIVEFYSASDSSRFIKGYCWDVENSEYHATMEPEKLKKILNSKNLRTYKK